MLSFKDGFFHSVNAIRNTLREFLMVIPAVAKVSCRHGLLLIARENKKEARLQASPPAAGRFCGIILFRRMAIPAKRFYVIGRTFL